MPANVKTPIRGGKEITLLDLVTHSSGLPTLRVFGESENRFYLKAVPVKITFNRGMNAKIESLTLIQNGNQTAKKK